MDDGLLVALTPQTDFIAGSISAPEILRRAISTLNETVALGLPSHRFNAVTETQHSDNVLLMNDLIEYDCNQAQGCFYPKPLNEEVLDHWLYRELRGECH